ncbi:hypothetical protein LTR37_013739 [Vermiconidia calcicola]|uniref:Uncharacterized protein n=1 Tax=Vermiconidia calcicola TaxID=1690605 RepID=A0ACC3MVK1_9PEZI|nr:hypothetical protein LTR37_013739 [Vermiconidia calcicola]
MGRTTRDEKARLQRLAARGNTQAQNFLRQAKPSGREGLQILINAKDWMATDKSARQEQKQRIDSKVQCEKKEAASTEEEGRNHAHEDLNAAILEDGEMSESGQSGPETTFAAGRRKRKLSSVTLSSGGEDEEPRKAVKPYKPRQRSSTSSPRKLPWLNGPSPSKQASPKPLPKEHKVKASAESGSQKKRFLARTAAKKASVLSNAEKKLHVAMQTNLKEYVIEISDDEDGDATIVDFEIRKLERKKRELLGSVKAIDREIFLLKEERASMS